MSVYSSKVLRDFFGTEEMRRIFSDETRVEKFSLIEVALAKVEAELGVIPEAAYDEIRDGASRLEIDWARLKHDTETIGYPVMPFLKQLAEACGASGQYLHWGSTTRDITDTATALQLGGALAIVDRDLRSVKDALVSLTRAHRDTVMIGRTHGMHALPTTFGFRTAIWLAEVDRQLGRLERVREVVRVGQFGGAVGTLAALGEHGLDVQRNLMRELGLKAPSISWFASRDRISEVVFVLAEIAGTMGSIAKTIVVMTRDEVREAKEPDVAGRGTSSAMPHKHNTVGSELVLVYAKMAAQFVSTALEAMVQDYDRDWQGHLETIVVPQAFLVTHAGVKQMAHILQGLKVFPERMRKNLDITNGLIMAESVMMSLAPKVGRTQAHELVSRACNAAIERDVHLRDVLHDDATVRAHLELPALDAAMDPANYIGSAQTSVDQVLREVAEGSSKG
jgi:3-carboxy-cis,cis-muconate cycloisomerase